MGAKSSKWTIIWLFHVFTVKASEGLASAFGDVIFKPASPVHVGSNVSIICVDTTNVCDGEFFFRLNTKEISPYWGNQTASAIQLLDVRREFNVVCYRQCNGLKHLVKDADLLVGYPPDKPRNITCSWDEFSTVMACTWSTGQETIVDTNYTVQVKNLQTGEETVVRREEASVTLPVTPAEKGTFQIQIIAKNQLNYSESDVVQIELSDIVVPLTPVITNVRKLGSDLHILINWRNWSSENQRYCDVEYSTPGEPAWIPIGEKINKNNRLSMNKIRNANSLRVRCREETGNSYWSRWSDPYLLPPSAPEDAPNVWRVLGPEHPNGTREVTLLITPDTEDLLNHRISGYKVFYSYNGTQTPVQDCPSSGGQCVALLPLGIKTVSVSAYSPYGMSPASDISVLERAEPGLDLAAPQNVTALSGSLTSVPVHWRRPESSEEQLQWFIIQWALDSCDGQQRNISWQKVGKDETSFTITDNISPGRMVAISVYAVYSSGVSQPGTVHGYSQEFHPKTGPKLEKDSQDARLVRWSEIPLCDRRGFITGYLLRQKTDRAPKEERFPASTRQFVLDGFSPIELYPVCISALTRGGEGPSDHCTLIQQDKSLHNYLGLLLGISFGGLFLAALTFTLSAIRKRLKTVLILCLPKYLCEDYPRADNSKAVTSLQEPREDPESTFCLLYSDPEITVIQELVQSPAPSPPTTSTEYTTATQEREVEEDQLLNLTTNDHIPDPPSGYRPQVTNIQRYDSYCSPSHMFDLQRALRAEGPIAPPGVAENSLLWDSGAEIDLDVFKVLDLSGVDNVDVEVSGSSQSAGDNCGLTLDWENQAHVQPIPSNQLICTLPAAYEELYATHSYFPQMFAKGQ